MAINYLMQSATKGLADTIKKRTNQASPQSTTGIALGTAKTSTGATSPSGTVGDGSNFNNIISQIGSTTPKIENELPLDTTSGSTSDYINQLKDAQRRSRIAALDSAKTGALSSLDAEQAAVGPMYYDKRKQAAGQSEVGAMNFAQYMASRGIKGAAGAMPEIYRNAGLQGQIGALDQQEAGRMADIERQRGLVNSNYEFDKAQANADVESQAMQSLIDQWNKNRDYRLQQAQLTGNLGGAPTIQKQQMDAQNTGYYNPWAAYNLDADKEQQLAPYMGDLQAYIDANPNGELTPYAQNARYQKIMSSPEYAQKYGSQYRTVNGMQSDLQNKNAELEIAMNEIKLSGLPEVLKLEAEKLRQEVAMGKRSLDSALSNIDNIRSRARSYSGGGSASGTTRAAEATKDVNSLYSYYEKDLPQNFQDRGKGIDEYLAYLQNPNVAPTIISDIGQTRYNTLLSWARAQVEAAGGGVSY